MDAIYKFSGVSKSFPGPEKEIEIFHDLNFAVSRGEALAVVGASGSGKSTLLHLMGALDEPSSGQIFFAGADMALMTPDEQARFRNQSLGFVFQFHHLLPEFSALENVAMPAVIAGTSLAEIKPRARELLERVGLEQRLEGKPATLSGGERQRVAIARALLLQPQVLLADEPTGNLDEGTASEIGQLILSLNRELGMTLVIVTHNQELASQMDRALELRAGALYEKVFA